jgi:hypothetical protein
MGNDLALQVSVVEMDAAHVLANIGDGLEVLHQAGLHVHHFGGHFGGVTGNIVARIGRHF